MYVCDAWEVANASSEFISEGGDVCPNRRVLYETRKERPFKAGRGVDISQEKLLWSLEPIDMNNEMNHGKIEMKEPRCQANNSNKRYP